MLTLEADVARWVTKNALRVEQKGRSIVDEVFKYTYVKEISFKFCWIMLLTCVVSVSTRFQWIDSFTPWEILIFVFQSLIGDRLFEYFLWYCPRLNTTRLQWWLVDTGSGKIARCPQVTSCWPSSKLSNFRYATVQYILIIDGFTTHYEFTFMRIL